MDIAVVDDEKAIREHICALIEAQKPESHIEAMKNTLAVIQRLSAGNSVDNAMEACRKLKAKEEFPITDKADKNPTG